MNEQIIAPGEAWEAVERLKININHITSPCEFGQWYATAPGPKWKLGWGDSPMGAVAALLERLGETATTQVEVANV